MRKFSSYGPVDADMNFYAPRKELIEKAWNQLTGENPDKGGHYITVWAPRQTGKTWLMQQILWRLQKDDRFHVLKINLEHLKRETDVDEIVATIAEEIREELEVDKPPVKRLKEFNGLFRKDVLDKPLVLIMDEFDALAEDAISGIAGVFRNIYVHRRDDPAPSHEKKYLLHGVALIGVRSVLGIENVKGSPFNVQRGIHIPELTLDEVDGMFKWYERESGRGVAPDVVERIYYETSGQPGLVSWLGELLT
ncbi:MAG: AAA family ATPase, partial [Deltaproteobacteria bacterium]|nr:AAA family ATPase [Deltaproteobacteria bacterium]